MTAEQQARDMLKRMDVEDAHKFTAGELVELANLIAERDHLLAVLNFIGTADPGGCELFPVGPSDTEYDDDGNILRHVGPWRFLDGKGDTFLAAVEDSMRRANAGDKPPQVGLD